MRGPDETADGIPNGDLTRADARDSRDARNNGEQGQKERNRGQNTSRSFGSSRDEKGLCLSRVHHPEFSPAECKFAKGCRYEHDLRKYLEDHKRADLQTFGGKCPVWEKKGYCDAGWKCRFVGSHMEEIERDGGRKELILIADGSRQKNGQDDASREMDKGVTNIVSTADKASLTKKKFPTPKADAYIQWIDQMSEVNRQMSNMPRSTGNTNENGTVKDSKVKTEEERAQYVDPPYLPSEKRRLYFGPETPVLAPLTTQGNLPFRRLCVSLGAQVTYSEMAMSLPLMQGHKPEWALLKAHESELLPPAYHPVIPLPDYNHAKDLKFGAQICANKPYHALKATEILTKLCPHLRVVDLNCGCPIDLVYRQGAGSALLDNQSKLEKMLRGMNAVSGEVPVSVKIRMGTANNKPTAEKLINRLVYGLNPDGSYSIDGPCGVAAITLHGRSRQQRYTKSADWSYIAECAALIKAHNEQGDALADTIREPDARNLPPSASTSSTIAPRPTFFIGNGDCYSHTDYFSSIASSGVSTVMLARGALIKPWLFEEIAAGQYLDKSASERLGYVEQFARFGLETWGSDEMGVGTTRRFLLEWLSFASRYVPIGILEHLPPRLQDRPPAWKGRNELETLLGSDNYRDWVKIRYFAMLVVL